MLTTNYYFGIREVLAGIPIKLYIFPAYLVNTYDFMYIPSFRISDGRSVIEIVFGMLVQRWQVLMYQINLMPLMWNFQDDFFTRKLTRKNRPGASPLMLKSQSTAVHACTAADN